MTLLFGVFDHIEPVPGLRLDRIYRERLRQIERFDAAGFFAYHLAEHHTPAIHSLAPSQNVFLASVAQRTSRLRFGPCVYVLPLHHPLRLIEEISMLDNLSDGRLAAPRRLEAERRGLTQFMHAKDGSFGFVGERPAGLPRRETRRDIEAELERFSEQKHRPHPNRIGGVALAGTPSAVREYMEEYIATGANYFVCSFQWGDLTHEQAMRSIELFATEVMPHYASAVGSTR